MSPLQTKGDLHFSLPLWLSYANTSLYSHKLSESHEQILDILSLYGHPARRLCIRCTDGVVPRTIDRLGFHVSCSGNDVLGYTYIALHPGESTFEQFENPE